MKLSYDLHIHTALSPCASDDMTPNNIVNMAVIKGLDAIAITDHNSSDNCISVIKAAKDNELVVIPGVELQTTEEVHLLCFFNEVSALNDFQSVIDLHMNKTNNNREIFGNQLIMDENDFVVGEKQHMLLTSSGLSLNKAIQTVAEIGGVVVPAHIERNSYSILGNLGFIPSGLNLATLEIYKNDHRAELIEKHKDLEKYRFLVNSDAHALGCISEAERFIEAKSKSIFDIIQAIK